MTISETFSVLRKKALLNGICMSDIMEMTIPELAEYIDIKMEMHNEKLKEKVAFDFRFLSAIRTFIWAKHPPRDARKVYPEIFESKEKVEDWKENKAKMQSFALEHNKKFKRRMRNET